MTEDVQTLARRLRVAEARVDEVEAGLVRQRLGAALALLVAGQLLAYLTVDQGRRPVTSSLLTFGTGALAFRGADGRHDGVSVALGVAFLGLSLLTVAALVVFASLLRRSVPLRRPVAAGAVVVLLGVGLLGAWATAALALVGGDDADAHLHAGLPVFTVGVVLLARVALGGSLPRREPDRAGLSRR